MSLIRIDELDSITTVNNANVLPIVDSNNETKKVSIDQLKTKLTEDIDLSDYEKKPTSINNTNPTYTISTLVGNYNYKLGEITSLTVDSSVSDDLETIIYFSSGSTATSISIPDSLVNIGDVPELTTSSNVSTGTCKIDKSYIISVLNNIAIWKEY